MDVDNVVSVSSDVVCRWYRIVDWVCIKGNVLVLLGVSVVLLVGDDDF